LIHPSERRIARITIEVRNIHKYQLDALEGELQKIKDLEELLRKIAPENTRLAIEIENLILNKKEKVKELIKLLLDDYKAESLEIRVERLNST